MATEFKPLVFDDGVDVVISFPGTSTTHTATAIDMKAHGVTYEYVDQSLGLLRVFRPWNTVSRIHQVVI
jgi:hypothetical protein